VRSPHFNISIDGHGFSFATGVVFEGLSIKEYDGDWSVTILGRLGNGQAVYARSIGPDIGSTAADLFRALSNRGSNYLWREDKFRR
jgi:hypothetical protein